MNSKQLFSSFTLGSAFILIIIVACQSPNFARQFASYASHPSYPYHPSYSSHPWPALYPKYHSYPTLPDEPAKTEFLKDIHCSWVPEVGAEPDIDGAAYGYPVPGCGGNTLVCSGIVECRVPLANGFSPTFNIENVMCTSTGTKCEEATQCVRKGGVLRSVGAKILPGLIYQKKSLKPTKRETKQRHR